MWSRAVLFSGPSIWLPLPLTSVKNFHLGHFHLFLQQISVPTPASSVPFLFFISLHTSLPLSPVLGPLLFKSEAIKRCGSFFHCLLLYSCYSLCPNNCLRNSLPKFFKKCTCCPFPKWIFWQKSFIPKLSMSVLKSYTTALCLPFNKRDTRSVTDQNKNCNNNNALNSFPNLIYRPAAIRHFMLRGHSGEHTDTFI